MVSDKLVGLPANGLDLALLAKYADKIRSGMDFQIKPNCSRIVCLGDEGCGLYGRIRELKEGCPSRAKWKGRKAKSGEDCPWMGGFAEQDWCLERSNRVA
jgi:hypothetical protein